MAIAMQRETFANRTTMLFHEIFLSHSGRQKGFAKDLYHSLSSLSYSVFFDVEHHSLPPGQAFPPLILSAANSCKLAIVVISEEFLCSRWPMIELCAFADRLQPSADGSTSSSSSSSSSSSEMTLLPLFLELSPIDLKRKDKLDKWREIWKGFETQGKRMSADMCERAVTKLLPAVNGIVRRPKSEQGEAAFIAEVVNAIFDIVPPRNRCRFGDTDHPGKFYVGKERLCQVIVNKFRELEQDPPFASDSSNSVSNIYVGSCILGMHGITGSGKSTLCRFLLDSMYDEFRGNVLILELPKNFDPNHMTAGNRLAQEYAKLLSMFHLHHGSRISSMNQLRNLLLGGSFNNRKRMFLVLDDINTSNYDRYKEMLQAILCSSILGPRSRVMLVAQSYEILNSLKKDLESITSRLPYRQTITEVPCLSETEAMEIMRHHYFFNRLSVLPKEDLMIRLLRKSSFQSSFMYIPIVFEMIGAILRDRNYADATEHLLELVDEVKKDAVQKLIGMIQLDDDLRVLFLDIALFIIPIDAGYLGLIDATLRILSIMHGGPVRLQIKMKELEKRCFLSQMGVKLQMHDIFLDYARSCPESSRTYINENITIDDPATTGEHNTQYCLPTNRPIKAVSARERYHQKHSLLILTKKYPGARTVIITIELSADYADNEIWLSVEVGAQARALVVRNRSRPFLRLNLSGDLSSLACVKLENVHQLAFSSTGSDPADLSNLVLLEWTNQNFRDVWMRKASNRGPKSKRATARRWFDLFVTTFLFLPQRFPPRNTPVALGGLKALKLKNSGIQRIENIGRLCPQLEFLLILADAHADDEILSVSIGDCPKLKELIVGKWRPTYTWFEFTESGVHIPHYFRENLRPRKSSKLVLRMNECPELQDVTLNVWSFHRVEVVGPLPSKLLTLCMTTEYSSANDIVPNSLVSSLLTGLYLNDTMVERLDFTPECLGSLPELEYLQLLSCARLTHVSLDLGCLPKLLSLTVADCHKLQAIEGSENLLRQQLKFLDFWDLPRLWCHVRLPSSGTEVFVQLKKIAVTQCPGVMIDINVLEAARSLRQIEWRGTCISLVRGQLCDIDMWNEILSAEHNPESVCLRNDGKDIINSIVFQGPKTTSTQEKGGVMSTCVFSEEQAPTHECSVLRGPTPTIASSSTSMPPKNRLTFWEGAFGYLETLDMEDQQHLREMEGIQHLHKLEHLTLWNLSILVSVSTTWPRSIELIMLGHCPMLRELPPLEDTPNLLSVECEECPQLSCTYQESGRKTLQT